MSGDWLLLTAIIIQKVMAQNKLIKIELTEREAEGFIALRHAGFFDARRCEVTVNIDSEGNLIDIWLRNLGWKRGDTYKKIKK